MSRIQPIQAPWPAQALHGAAGSRRVEHAALATVPAHTLMRRAGLATAQLALAVAPHARHIWVAAGPGNNGGDGLEAALHLHAAGRTLWVSLHADAARLPSDAADALQRAQAAGVPIAPAEAAPPWSPDAADLAIDALLGIGATRAPDGAMAQTVRRLNALASPVLAIDIPSGLHPATGQPPGADAVVAQHTLSLLTLKPGLFTGRGRDHAGHVWFDDLGCAATDDAPPDAWLAGYDPPAPRRHDQHKGSFGDVGIVAGAGGMVGAALLAARAAHAAGAGRVHVHLLADSADRLSLDPVHPELMFRRFDAPTWPAGATIACGCGGGEAVVPLLPALLAGAARLVLDADALNAIAGDAALQAALRERAARSVPTILTPHPLEAARLLGATTAQVQSDRLAAAAELADRLRCVVLLKGSGSIVATPGAVPRINPTGNARLATAGTGDVLAGWLAGRWAQAAGSEPALPPWRVACRAAYEHGAAADEASGEVLRAGDLIEALYRAAQTRR